MVVGDRLSVLLSTVDQEDSGRQLVANMGINGDVVVVNQGSRTSTEWFPTPEGVAQVVNIEARGIGRSRNLALAHTDAPVALFADDDVTYRPDYEERIMHAFAEFPSADVILFELESSDTSRGRGVSAVSGRTRLAAFKYGGPKIACRTASVKHARVAFSELFGGGAPYAAGEDTLFIRDCLARGLKVYRAGVVIGHVDYSDSTWFTGYGEDYLHDRGALFRSMFGAAYLPAVALFALKHRRKFEVSAKNAVGFMREGANCVVSRGTCTRHGGGSS